MSTFKKIKPSLSEAQEISLNGYHGMHQNIAIALNDTIDAPHANGKWIVGLEIEKCNKIQSRYTNSDIAKQGWKLERDGSVPYGFELVSPMLLLHSKTSDKRILEFSEFIDAPFDTTCGGHINLSCEGKTPTQILNTVKGFLPIIYSMNHNRIYNRFCVAKKPSNLLNDKMKYQSVAIWDNRIEFRIFSAVRNTKQLLWRVALMRLMTNRQNLSFASVVCRILTSGTSLNRLFRKVYEEDKLIVMCERAITINQSFSDVDLSNAEIAKIDAKLRELKAKQANTPQTPQSEN